MVDNNLFMHNNKNILLINKPKFWTSNDVVQKVKNIIKAKKVGHAGTLDPYATGLLVLGINEGTKDLNNLITLDKEYIAEIKFGLCTDTYDITGNVIEITNNIPTKDTIINVINSLSNNYTQTVPIYSAVKKDGKKLYEYARSNANVELPSKNVKIYNCEILNFLNGILHIKLKVSKGFYVRSFAYDLGKLSNSSATLINLHRTKISNYDINNAIEIKDVYDYWFK